MKKPISPSLSYIELSHKNLEHNLAALRSIAKPGVKIACAVKGNAYGHGQNEIVRMAEQYADYFMVNSLEELRTLRTVSQKPTFVLGYVLPLCISEAITLGCILGIFSRFQLEQVEKIAKKMNVVQEVHLACDALLGREGFLESEFSEILSAVKNMKHVCATGMYAHFANIEDTNNFTHAERQIQAYARMRESAEKAGYTDVMTHISATSGLLTHEYSNGSNPLVRIGIGMYGLWPSDHLAYSFKKKLTLKPVLSWKTHIAQVKKLPAGRTIGYGLTFMTKKVTTIALIPQGYADGYQRSLSNKGEVLIAGKRCPVLGRVSMNMFVVDVSRVPHAQEGDEVVLLGVSGKQSITAEQLGELSGTINYEVVTRINPLLPRVIVK